MTSFRLQPEDPSASGLAGQYLTVRLEPDGPDARRCCAATRCPRSPARGGYRISVKREPGGAGGAFLHERVRVGDRLAAAAPRGTFVLRDGDGPVVLMSAGVGATPVLAMLHALAREPTPRPVWWVHGARNGAEHAFGAEVDALLAALPDAHRLVSYSAPGPSDVAGEAFDVAGRLDAAALAAAGVPVDADYYLCGPDGFMRGLGAALTARGVPPERVGTEVFGSAGAFRPGMVDGAGRPPHPPPGPPGAGPAVRFSRSDLAVPWDPGYGSLLELAEACDVPVGFGCRTGVCHSCVTGVLAGSVEYVTAPLEPPPAGEALLCCSRPASELTLDL